MADPQYTDSDCGHGASSAPLVAGTARGLRVFRIDPDGWLRGVSYRVPWKVGENVAECYVTERVGHPLEVVSPGHYFAVMGGVAFPSNPEEATRPLGGYRFVPCQGLEQTCGCGFYAYHVAERARYGTAGQPGCLGIIEGYGKVIVGPYGFRAQKARIVALVLPPPEAGMSEHLEWSLDQMRTAVKAGRQWAKKLTVGALHVGRNPRRLLAVTAVLAPVVAFTPPLMPFGVAVLGGLGALAILSELSDRAFLKSARKGILRSVAGIEQQMHYLLDVHAAQQQLPRLVRARYPGVQVYESEEEMLAAHPLENLGHLAGPQRGEAE